VFLESLQFGLLSLFQLLATYEGWLTRVVGLQAAALSGRYEVAGSAEALAVPRGGAGAGVRDRIRVLMAEAKGERNLRRLVEINLEVKRLVNEQ
jgi:hypothetical protein